ncbi:MAG: hypothetical protein Ta2D_10970 [Rickettsiales bacterium]|nr:MAG: hypothetical protein Ta2D_10970 [Rickettsiales bacterium]
MSNLLDPDMLFGSACVGIISCGVFYLDEMPYIKVITGFLTLVAMISLITNFVKSIRGTDSTSRIIKSGEANTDKIIQTFRESSEKNHQEIMSLIQVLANKK